MSFMLGVTNTPFTLSVIMLNDVILTVVMLSFVILAPFHLPVSKKTPNLKIGFTTFRPSATNGTTGANEHAAPAPRVPPDARRSPRTRG